MSLAESIWAGCSHLAHLDPLREDEAGRVPRAVAGGARSGDRQPAAAAVHPAPLPGGGGRAGRGGVEMDRLLGLSEQDPVTLALDSTTTEVYGMQKEEATYNYEGKLSFGSLLCTWAERRRVVAAALRPGSGSDKPVSPRWCAGPCAPSLQGTGKCGCGPTAASTARPSSPGAAGTGCGSAWWCPATS